MVTEHSAAINAQDDFEDGMQRLGWLSAYARQALLSRHLLRDIASIDEDEHLPHETLQEYTLTCFRSIITILSGVNKDTAKFSSPYSPQNRPETHYIAFSRKERIFETSSASGAPSTAFYLSSGSSFGFDHTNYSTEDQILLFEIKEIGKGATLSTKSISDERILSLRDEPLWRGMSTGEEKDCLRFTKKLATYWPNVWSFWHEWYQAFANGNPLDWDLQKEIALISDDIWEGEDAAQKVADEITAIKRNFLSQKNPLAENIEFNADTGKFHAVPIEVVKPDLVTATLSQLSDALEDVLAEASNGLTSKSREVRVIERTLGKHANDPQQIELNLSSVADRLRRQIHTSGELPDTEENLALLKTAEDCAIAIRATHPAVAENREILARQRFTELPESDKSVLESAKEPLILLSEAIVAEDFAQDIPALLNTSIGPTGNYAPSLPGVTRTFGRIARIGEKLADDDVLNKIKQHKGYKAIEVLLVGTGLGGFIAKLVEIGLRLLGGVV